MKCKQLVTGDPNFVGIMDASKEGTGGGVMDRKDEYVPIVFQLEWP